MNAYTAYRPLWVPRPEKKIPRAMLGFYENQGFWSQTKKNGTCTLIYANANGSIYKTRHPDVNDGEHKMWRPEADHNEFFAARNGWNVYCAELLHSKVTGGPKNELYIFDIIVSDSVELTGTTFAERQELLHDRFSGTDEGDQVRIAPRITLAKCSNEGFDALFNDLKPEDEGLVLKDPRAKLKPCFKIDSNSGWQCKVRIPHKNYGF